MTALNLTECTSGWSRTIRKSIEIALKSYATRLPVPQYIEYSQCLDVEPEMLALAGRTSATSKFSTRAHPSEAGSG